MTDSDRPLNVKDDPAASITLLASVAFRTPTSLTQALEWAMNSPSLVSWQGGQLPVDLVVNATPPGEGQVCLRAYAREQGVGVRPSGEQNFAWVLSIEPRSENPPA